MQEQAGLANKHNYAFHPQEHAATYTAYSYIYVYVAITKILLTRLLFK